MRTVWKFTLEIIDGDQTLLMPAGAEIVHAAMQYGSPTIWAQVESEADTTARYFAVTGTGHPAPTDGSHVGTATEQGFPLVWHIWETSR